MATEPPYDVGQVQTAYFPAVTNQCGWCGIRLTAIPDDPKEFNGRYYHPTGCISAARASAIGYHPLTRAEWGMWE